ncbi:MAG: hypothetical protein ACOX2L_06000 [Anaerolineae bacterium]|jgi:hypothetical protein|nr:hypothetical protein [Chloroflexota bacterium]
MGDNDTQQGLSTRQRRFVAALLATPSVREAARVAQVGEATAWQYLRLPVVRQEVRRRTEGMITQASAGLLAEMAESRAVLLQVMRNQAVSDAVRVSAASKVLDAGMRLFELVSLSDRVSELERRLGDGS